MYGRAAQAAPHDCQVGGRVVRLFTALAQRTSKQESKLLLGATVPTAVSFHFGVTSLPTACTHPAWPLQLPAPRDDEVRRAIQILSRRTKNNPVLIGASRGGEGWPAYLRLLARPLAVAVVLVVV